MSVFLFLYGYGGTAPGHWQPLLADALRERGATVLFPALPRPASPDRHVWLEVLESVLKPVEGKPIVILGHSLGCALWLHYLKQHPLTPVRKAFFAAPTPNDCGIPEIRSFFPLPAFSLAHPEVYEVIGSNNDPYISQADSEALAQTYGIRFHFLPDAGHINIAAGFGRWPWLEAKCFSLMK